MIACETFQVKLNKTFHKILYLSTAVDDTFAFLAVVSTGRVALYHCDRFGKILYEYKFEHPVDSFMMMNKREVVIYILERTRSTSSIFLKRSMSNTTTNS